MKSNLNSKILYYSLLGKGEVCVSNAALYFRLHKIGKNPHLVSSRATLESDCRQISDIVSALAQATVWICLFRTLHT